MSRFDHQHWRISELSYQDLTRAAKAVVRAEVPQEIRLAVLGDCATQHYCAALAATFKLRGYWPHLYEAEYGVIQQEVMNGASELYRHDPEFILLFNCVQHLEDRVTAVPSMSAVLDEVFVEIVNSWKSIRLHCRAKILQHNFCLPLDRTFGNHTSFVPHSFANLVALLNNRLAEVAQEMGVFLIDTEYQASLYGKMHWLDERMWCQAKQALSMKYLAPLAKCVSDAVLEKKGKVVKCVVLDLDNTLWGGVLGDLGIEGIEIGDVGIGYVFQRFQSLFKRLKDRGVLLAVCSKNEQSNALRVFQEHPEMILDEEDIAVFIANYTDKATNIREIQRRLNIGFDSFLFLDDSPHERELVRIQLPEVQVPDLPEDPGEYLKTVLRWSFFESSAFTEEDAQRTQLYKNIQVLEDLKQQHTDIESFLMSLEMRAEIQSFNNFTLPRVAQLIQRSNQFNLTTFRYSEDELKNISLDQQYVTFSIRLLDRLGDSGIIAAVIGRIESDRLVIDTWIMSCRVLSRRVEDLTIYLMKREAQKRGCKLIVGQYRKTDKNKMVSDIYQRFHFSIAGLDGDVAKFELPIDVSAVDEYSIPIKKEFL